MTESDEENNTGFLCLYNAFQTISNCLSEDYQNIMLMYFEPGLQADMTPSYPSYPRGYDDFGILAADMMICGYEESERI